MRIAPRQFWLFLIELFMNTAALESFFQFSSFTPEKSGRTPLWVHPPNDPDEQLSG
jgi:hypothetical protein